MADADFDSFSGCFETDVTSTSTSSSRLSFFNVSGIGASLVCATVILAKPNRLRAATTNLAKNNRCACVMRELAPFVTRRLNEQSEFDASLLRNA
jgi:hypothetical protein